MMRALWTASSGMCAQQLNIDTIANNLANVNTSGFRKSRVDFQELMYETVQAAGAYNGVTAERPIGVQVGHGVRVAATQKLFSQGNLQNTGNPLDIAIQGNGFFQVLLNDGETVAYTRDGAFKLDAEGRIVTSNGNLLLGEGSEIIIDPDAVEITINSNGEVYQTLVDGEEPELVGTITLVNFVNPAGLSSLGNNLFAATPASGEAQEMDPATANMSQYYLEMSNVQVVEEMVNMIVAQRAYEINSKAIITSDEMLSIANNLRR